MAAGMVFVLTLPGVVLLLVALATVERLATQHGRRGRVSGRSRPRLSASAFDVFSAALSPGPAVQAEQRRVEQLVRDDETAREPVGAAVSWCSCPRSGCSGPGRRR